MPKTPKNPKTNNPELNAEDAQSQRFTAEDAKDAEFRRGARKKPQSAQRSQRGVETARFSGTDAPGDSARSESSATSSASLASSAVNSGISASSAVNSGSLRPMRDEDAVTPEEEAQLVADEVQADSAVPGGPATTLQANWDKNTVAGILDDVAVLLELAGGNQFEVRAYPNASRAISGLEGDINELLESGQLARTPGVGKTILSRVTELLETGRIQFYEQLLQEVP